MYNILICVSGSVAAIKTTELVEKFKSLGDVRVVFTDSALHFQYPKADLVGCETFTDKDEWETSNLLGKGWTRLGDPILHIDLRRWASCLVLAPCSANTLAKISNGLCDNLLTNIVRAWDWNKPLFLAPAMNTLMWENDPTNEQITTMRTRGAHIINPVCKRLACDDVGMGAMASIDDIFNAVNNKLRWRFPLKNCNGIPINHHPGAFGFHRRKNHHTGVDLYTNDEELVYAVEDGKVVNIDVFTGPKLGHDWWEETHGVMIEGASGVVNYGEVTPLCHFGQKVRRGDAIACVKRVLFPEKHRPDIPGHSTSMLHLELYKEGTRDFADWHDPQKNPNLLDPTAHLMAAEYAPKTTLSWDNSAGKTVG